MSDNGEIASLADSPLQAGNLDDFRSHAAREQSGGYGDDADERAIDAIVSKLQAKPAFQNVSREAIVEKAESLYAVICQQVQTGVPAQQLVKYAELVGEKPAALKARLS